MVCRVLLFLFVCGVVNVFVWCVCDLGCAVVWCVACDVLQLCVWVLTCLSECLCVRYCVMSYGLFFVVCCADVCLCFVVDVLARCV